MCIFFVSACSRGENSTYKIGEGKISIVCTTFPQYDWFREIVGKKSDEYDIKFLMSKGTDLHSYQASAEDIAIISNSDLLIYVGGESDKWVRDILEDESINIRAISLLEVLGNSVKKEEIVDGMEPDDHDHDNEHDHDDHDNRNFYGYDEHVWLSLKNAQLIITKIKDALVEIDNKNSEIYTKNYNNYIEKLSELDAEYQKVVDLAETKVVLFADRFPFRYLVDDYGLNYHAAFAGCSAETEASFETIAFLSKKVDDLELKSVLVIENSNQKLANTIIKNTLAKNQNILVMDSLQSVNDKKIKDGYSYLLAMKNNLETLKKALN